jgi:hypothetical protein
VSDELGLVRRGDVATLGSISLGLHGIHPATHCSEHNKLDDSPSTASGAFPALRAHHRSLPPDILDRAKSTSIATREILMVTTEGRARRVPTADVYNINQAKGVHLHALRVTYQSAFQVSWPHEYR